MIEIGILIAIVGCFVGLAGWLSGRDKKISNDAEWKGSVNAKLDNINVGVNGTNTKIEAAQLVLGDHGERLRAVEESAKQAHHRIDELKKGTDNK
jgi:outer membrane murein-binding lipoprotein Lpp